MWNINFPHQAGDCFGKPLIEFTFEDRPAWIVLPDADKANGCVALKMEYGGAFPDTEMALVEKGYVRAFLQNKNRWGQDEDHDAKVRFIEFLHKELGTRKQVVLIGMSCGGFHSVNFASRHPEYVSAMYLDAPLLNMLSYPMGYGIGTQHTYVFEEEIAPAYGFTLSDLIAYRDMPIDRIHTLVENRIPVAITAGDADKIVPYVENGKYIEDAYRGTDIPFFLRIVSGRDHHPHGLEDPSPVVEFIEKYAHSAHIS